MITINNLHKTFAADTENVAALKNVNLTIQSGKFFTLLGPSGCGKSTLLRCVAGLETPDSGEIVIHGAVMFSSTKGINVPPNLRRIGMVFQSYAIWPHMTVHQNVAFPLKVQGKSDHDGRVNKALDLVGLGELGGRYASRLSGGQQQRVALARALVSEPGVLLLDEPLSNLDAALRDQMRSELRRLQESLKVTAIYVTHDQVEALSLSDDIALMRSGEVAEVATPQSIYQAPQSAFAAQFIGAANIVEGRLSAGDQANGECAVTTPFGTVSAKSERARVGLVRLCIRPERIKVLLNGTAPERNVFPAAIKTRSFLGHSMELALDMGGGVEVRCICPDADALHGKDAVFVHVSPADVYVLPDR